MDSSDNTISPWPASAPWTRPVSPPWVTTGWPREWQSARIAELFGTAWPDQQFGLDAAVEQRGTALAYRRAFQQARLAHDGSQIGPESGNRLEAGLRHAAVR